MEPRDAHCRRAPASRPASTPLFEPAQWNRPDQPPLPWSSTPEVVDATSFVPASLRRTARDLVTALVETLNNRRPLHQLEPWLSPDVLALVEQLPTGRAGSVLKLQSLRVQQPTPEILEVTLHLRQAERSRAAAARLSGFGGRWQITGLAIALDPPLVHHAGRLPQWAG